MTTPSAEADFGGGETTPVDALLAAVSRVQAGGPAVSELLVAFSGGLDSTCLLASAAESKNRHGKAVRALHVDHAWSTESGRWAAHCLETSRRLGVACEVKRLVGEAPTGASREAWAREQRYAVLQSAMSPGSLLLTAHHESDQAETFLLMALRGSGPHGLAGIAAERAFGPGRLARPFLDLSRQVLETFARTRGLGWLEDPANADESFDRNFLRARVLPLLAERWPSATTTLARSARWQRAFARLEVAQGTALLEGFGAADTLPLSALADMPAEDAVSVVRAWLRRRGVPLPPSACAERLLHEVLPAGDDRQPLVRWGKWALRRHRGALHLTAASLPPLMGTHRWQWAEPLVLACGTLSAVSGFGAGLSADAIRGRVLEVRARQGGERLRRAGDLHHRSLKHLWQEAGTPPWQRGRTPLVFLDGELVAVPGLGYAAGTAASGDQSAVRFEWQPLANAP